MSKRAHPCLLKKYMRKLLTALLIRNSRRGKVNVLLFTKTSIYNHATIYKPENTFQPRNHSLFYWDCMFKVKQKIMRLNLELWQLSHMFFNKKHPLGVSVWLEDEGGARSSNVSKEPGHNFQFVLWPFKEAAKKMGSSDTENLKSRLPCRLLSKTPSNGCFFY